MRVTVVGDALLDEDLDGTSSRLCPDAPVPVVEVSSRACRAGGAGLVATMLAREGHEVVLVTALSDDDAAERLRACLVGVRVVAGASGAPTPVKTRLRANGRPLGRLDEGCEPAPVPEVTTTMLAAIADSDVIVAADYGRGLLAEPTLRAALERRPASVPLVWDPHPRGAEPVPSSSLVTPNAQEAAAAASLSPDAEPARIGAALRQRWGCRAVAMTVGEAGAVLLEVNAEPVHVRVDGVADADPCGAGDRFASAAAVALAETGDVEQAVRAGAASASAYLAAGGVASLVPLIDQEVVTEEGIVTVDRTATAESTVGSESTAGSPAMPPSQAGDAAAVISAVRARGGTVVATGGCFDLLHAGHVRTLQAARDMGDCLIVCLNSDDSVRRLKGAQRPLIGERDRAELLGALACVDAVVVFAEDGPEQVLSRLRPDVWVKGGDYSAAALPEARLLQTWGGRTVTLPFHIGRSTTALAAKLADVV